MSAMNRLKALAEQGQAVWLDYIRRDILQNGHLAGLVDEDGVSGVTSNPAIFQKAIGGSDLYDEDIRHQLESEPDLEVSELYERIAVRDIQLAADILRPVYERSGGADGFVSLEVSPHLASDREGTLEEARRLWRRVARPNLMIKVPATPEGVQAFEELLAEGISVNVTLMFSLAHYEAVAQAYLRGVDRASEPARVASVASFFVSRVDSKVDKLLEELGSEEALALRGRIGIANSKMAYQRYKEIFEGGDFAALATRGARPQRVLWASTSTKNPDYRDVLYIEELIGPATVNTVPPATVEAFRDHGTAARTLDAEIEAARSDLEALAALGIDLNAVTQELQEEGLAKFAQPFDTLLETLADKRGSLAAAVTAE
jgi:transaldolase